MPKACVHPQEVFLEVEKRSTEACQGCVMLNYVQVYVWMCFFDPSILFLIILILPVPKIHSSLPIPCSWP